MCQAHHIIGAEQFGATKHGSYLLNASRRSVVDISALIDAMNSGEIGGAALDVYPNERRANGEATPVTEYHLDAAHRRKYRRGSERYRG
ncbi:hypothetical protein LA080_003215 [Diaporthe eres]|nr:hypothetical protein LA080_003215 [Diaporthe eres]